jgi:hypothetical protein
MSTTPREYYLLDWDWDYTSLTVLRGWSLTTALLGALHEQFCADWFRNPEAGRVADARVLVSALGERLEDLRDRLLGTAWDAELFATALGARMVHGKPQCADAGPCVTMAQDHWTSGEAWCGRLQSRPAYVINTTSLAVEMLG